MPQTIRDAILLRLADLSDRARATAEAAAVAGPSFELELISALDREDGLEELLAGGLLGELGDGRAAFRHPLARDAIYGDVPWLRRRALHREIATEIEARGGQGTEVAAHWLAARDETRALDSLLQAIDDLARVHATPPSSAARRLSCDRRATARTSGSPPLSVTPRSPSSPAN